MKHYAMSMDSDNSDFSNCNMGLKYSPDVFGYLSFWKSFLLCNRKKSCLTEKMNSIMPPFPCINKKVGVVILWSGKGSKNACLDILLPAVVRSVLARSFWQAYSFQTLSKLSRHLKSLLPVSHLSLTCAVEGMFID